LNGAHAVLLDANDLALETRLLAARRLKRAFDRTVGLILFDAIG
tara:strand:+ start:1276 stop:1407 length:132 start_codon:yes stop_codon:yes gene_type:complete